MAFNGEILLYIDDFEADSYEDADKIVDEYITAIANVNYKFTWDSCTWKVVEV